MRLDSLSMLGYMRLYSKTSTKHDIRQDAHVDAGTCRLEYMRKTCGIHSAWGSALYACRDALYTMRVYGMTWNIHQDSDYTHVERRRGHV